MIKITWHKWTFFMFSKEIDYVTWYVGIYPDCAQVKMSATSFWHLFELLRSRAHEIDLEIERMEKDLADPPF